MFKRLSSYGESWKTLYEPSVVEFYISKHAFSRVSLGSKEFLTVQRTLEKLFFLGVFIHYSYFVILKIPLKWMKCIVVQYTRVEQYFKEWHDCQTRRTLLLEIGPSDPNNKLLLGVLLVVLVALLIKRPKSAADSKSSSSFMFSKHLDHAGISLCVCPMSDGTMWHSNTPCKCPGVLAWHLHLGEMNWHGSLKN